MKIALGVAHHKKSYIIADGFYIPIHVGATNSKVDLMIQRDDIGLNISKKNPIYCEITALYWLIHNVEAEYYGLCHYRRYFTFKRNNLVIRIIRFLKFFIFKLGGSFLFFSRNFTLQYDCEVSNNNKLLEHTIDFERRLKKCIKSDKIDIISTYPLTLSHFNVKIYFSIVIGSFHLDLLEDIYREYLPDDFQILKEVLLGCKLSSANMAIYKKDLAQEYIRYLVNILNIHEQKSRDAWCQNPLSDGAYSRIAGYLAEILNNVFILKVQKKRGRIKYVNKVFCSNL